VGGSSVEYIKIDTERPIPWIISRAKKILEEGGVIALPTETVYGLVGDLFSQKAVKKIYQLKGRDLKKPLPVFIPTVESLPLYVEDVPASAKKVIHEFWPGPLTIVLKRKETLDIPFSTSTLGLRIPDHSVPLMLLEKFGPLASTSANPSGKIEVFTAEDVKMYFNGEVDMILDGGKSYSTIPSTVIDFTTPTPRIVREGQIREEQIKRIINGWG